MLRQGIMASSPNNFRFKEEDAGFDVVIVDDVVVLILAGGEENHLLHERGCTCTRLVDGWAAKKRATTTIFLVPTRIGILRRKEAAAEQWICYTMRR